jgi:hypothetical protein
MALRTRGTAIVSHRQSILTQNCDPSVLIKSYHFPSAWVLSGNTQRRQSDAAWLLNLEQKCLLASPVPGFLLLNSVPHWRHPGHMVRYLNWQEAPKPNGRVSLDIYSLLVVPKSPGAETTFPAFFCPNPWVSRYVGLINDCPVITSLEVVNSELIHD